MDCERIDCAIAGVCFHHRDVHVWLKCMGWRMKAITEQDRIAARALAKRLVKELGGMNGIGAGMNRNAPSAFLRRLIERREIQG